MNLRQVLVNENIRLTALEETASSRADQLTLGMGTENMLPDLVPGDFGVLQDSPSCLSLSLLLCVRCQVPPERGGLGSPAVFIDGGNSFNPYEVSDVARRHGLDPKAVLERVIISRAFTAHQLTSLIIDGLSYAIDKYAAKLALISDITGPYLDADVPEKEARDVFSKLTLFLSRLSAERKAIIVAVHFTRRNSARDLFFESTLLGRANVLVRTGGNNFTGLVPGKNPVHKPKVARPPVRVPTLSDFMGA